MLILSRNIGERIIIQDDIIIELVSVQGYQVKFGITAPQDISVHREEIYRKIKNGVIYVRT